MIAELVCSAVALLLYVNTLDADFCYDDRLSFHFLRGSVPQSFLYTDLIVVFTFDSAVLWQRRLCQPHGIDLE
ncbi:hypothetical protein cypCar_00020564 [Cyprinus carpio]|nr:hypothetical protein cypCar_00020564 [Cyprinus carpio]